MLKKRNDGFVILKAVTCSTTVQTQREMHLMERGLASYAP